MEGNPAYKLTTLQRFINQTGARPIQRALDIGCHVGAITNMIAEVFPTVDLIHAYDITEPLCNETRERTAALGDRCRAGKGVRNLIVDNRPSAPLYFRLWVGHIEQLRVAWFTMC